MTDPLKWRSRASEVKHRAMLPLDLIEGRWEDSDKRRGTGNHI